MRGLDAAADSLGEVQSRLRRMFGMGRLTEADYKRLDEKIEKVRADMRGTKEQNGHRWPSKTRKE